MTRHARPRTEPLGSYDAALEQDRETPPPELDPALAAVARRLEQALHPPGPEEAFVAALRGRLRDAAGPFPASPAAPPASTGRRWWRTPFPARRWSVLLLAALLALALAGTAVASTSLLRLQRPEQHPSGGNTMVMAFAGAMPWILCQPAAFQPLDPSRVAPLTGRPIAYLPVPPAGMDAPPQVSLIGTPGRWPQPDAIAYGPRAVVRYHGGGHTLIVELDEVSPGMALKSILVGERTIQLPDGRQAYASTFPGWPVPNAVAFAADRSIVTVASDLPAATVEQLAAAVLVAPAAAAPTGDGVAAIPIASVGPIAGTAPAAPAVTGTVQHSQGRWPDSRLHVRYAIAIAATACTRPAQQVQAAVEFPPALAAHAIDPNPPVGFASLGSAGFGGDVAFDVSGMPPATVQAALAGGIAVRVSWVEDGRRKERTFTIR
jgi:hypothetical protein